MCADCLPKTMNRGVTQSLKNLSQLRWLAQRPLVQMNHQTTILALKGETEQAALCRVSTRPHFSIFIGVSLRYPITSSTFFVLWSLGFYNSDTLLFIVKASIHRAC